MAAVSRSRRSASGIALLIGGALLLLALLLPLMNVSAAWLGGLAAAAIAVGLGILGFGAVNSTVAKITLIAAAIGWLILAISGLGINLPSVLITIAALVAGIAGLIAAIVLYVGKEIKNTPALLFIATTALGLLYLLGVIGTLSLGTLGTVIAVLFAAGLIITGVLFTQTERSRR